MAALPLDWLNGDIGGLRARYETERARSMPPNARWRKIEAVRVLDHQVEETTAAAIVYFHGGGFIVGSPLTHADITAQLCRRTGLPVHSLDYRLAPEHVAPAPMEDGRVVVERLVADGVRAIILCGDSAGGAIALALDASLPPTLRRAIIGVCSFYGAYGEFDTPSLRRSGSRADGTDAACLRRYFALATEASVDNPYAIAALAKASPVPVYLMAGSDDPLRDDTLGLAQGLRAAGRETTLYTAAGESHGFLHKVETSREATGALDDAARWIRQRTGMP